MDPFENPPLPEGEDVVVADISFYKPIDSIILKWYSEGVFVSLQDHLDPDLLKTPPSSEDELSDNDIEIIDDIPFRGASILEEVVKVTQEEQVKKKDTVPIVPQDDVTVEIEKLGEESLAITIDEDTEKEEGSTEKVSVVTNNILEINLDSEDSETNEDTEMVESSTQKLSVVTNNILEINLDSEDSETIESKTKSKKQQLNSIKEFVKCMRRLSDEELPEYDRSHNQNLKKKKRDCYSRSPGNFPKRIRYSSPDIPQQTERYHTPRQSRRRQSLCRRRRQSSCQRQSPCRYQSPRRRQSPRHRQSPCRYQSPRRRQSPHWSQSQLRHRSPRRRHLSPQHVRDEKRHHRQIIHYIDANSDQDFELSEIRISSKVVKKVPPCQENSEKKIQRNRIPDDPKSPRKADSDSEKADIKAFAFENYYCKDCQLTLNSKLTWESHIVGKRHKKAIQCQAIHEIAKGSIRIPPNPEFASVDKPRFANPTAGKKFVRLKETAKLQRLVNEETKHPMPGLNHVIEIRSDNVTSYYCEICDAPCQVISIMPHLIGFNHQMLCLKEIDREFYEEAKHVTRKKSIMRKLLGVLFNHQDQHGKGRIRVYLEKPDPKAITNPIESLYFDRPGPSWGNVAMKPEHDEGSESGKSNDEYLDTSKSDFYCTLCDSHMNNLNMWAAHVRGKRHLKNAKKDPGEKPSKKKSVKAPPHLVSKLESKLCKEARGQVICGLDYIRETQSKSGEIYNCFLCCACATNYDIIDHITLTKHQIKYLTKLETDGKSNGITDIANMDIRDVYIRDHLIEGECQNMVERYGQGKVEVYISKDV